MSTLSTANIESKAANTPPVIKDLNGTECGQFCRAWVNFNGSGTVAIKDSFNVSSVTDNGTGDYTVNFTTAMSDANYAYTYGITYNSATRESVVQVLTVLNTSIRILTGYSYTSPGAVDLGSISLATFGG